MKHVLILGGKQVKRFSSALKGFASSRLFYTYIIQQNVHINTVA